MLYFGLPNCLKAEGSFPNDPQGDLKLIIDKEEYLIQRKLLKNVSSYFSQMDPLLNSINQINLSPEQSIDRGYLHQFLGLMYGVDMNFSLWDLDKISNIITFLQAREIRVELNLFLQNYSKECPLNELLVILEYVYSISDGRKRFKQLISEILERLTAENFLQKLFAVLTEQRSDLLQNYQLNLLSINTFKFYIVDFITAEYRGGKKDFKQLKAFYEPILEYYYSLEKMHEDSVLELKVQIEFMIKDMIKKEKRENSKAIEPQIKQLRNENKNLRETIKKTEQEQKAQMEQIWRKLKDFSSDKQAFNGQHRNLISPEKSESNTTIIEASSLDAEKGLHATAEKKPNSGKPPRSFDSDKKKEGDDKGNNKKKPATINSNQSKGNNPKTGSSIKPHNQGASVQENQMEEAKEESGINPGESKKKQLMNRNQKEKGGAKINLGGPQRNQNFENNSLFGFLKFFDVKEEDLSSFSSHFKVNRGLDPGRLEMIYDGFNNKYKLSKLWDIMQGHSDFLLLLRTKESQKVIGAYFKKPLKGNGKSEDQSVLLFTFKPFISISPKEQFLSDNLISSSNEMISFGMDLFIHDESNKNKNIFNYPQNFFNPEYPNPEPLLGGTVFTVKDLFVFGIKEELLKVSSTSSKMDDV